MLVPVADFALCTLSSDLDYHLTLQLAKHPTFHICVFKNVYILFLKDFVYLFLDKGERKDKERKKNINVWSPLMCLSTGDLACDPGMCPDWESNQRPSGSQSGAQSTEPHQPVQKTFF